MTNTELIRQEIKRLQEEQLDENRHFKSIHREGVFDGLSLIDAFIDSLPKEDETVIDCNEYSTVEEELDAFIKSGKAIKEENCGSYTTTYIDPLKVARHFYELGLNARKEAAQEIRGEVVKDWRGKLLVRASGIRDDLLLGDKVKIYIIKEE